MTKETELLGHIFARSAGLHKTFEHVLVGPGDDCAVVRHGAHTVLLTVDHLVERCHYEPSTPVDLIARKSIGRSVSDIAAMGGTPDWALATALLPHDATQIDPDELFDRMAHWASHWNCPLVGGDIATAAPGPEGDASPLVLTVTVGGSPHQARGPVLRTEARPGDDVYVTGRLGGSLASERHLRVQPRVAEGVALCEALGDELGAMLDVSDGLGLDASRIARASGVRIELDAARVPTHEGCDWRAALGDGEDYELCFTARPDTTVPDALGPDDTPVTRIGRVLTGAGCIVRTPDGAEHDASDMGWLHGTG